jgi:hypothetical protein
MLCSSGFESGIPHIFRGKTDVINVEGGTAGNRSVGGTALFCPFLKNPKQGIVKFLAFHFLHLFKE